MRRLVITHDIDALCAACGTTVSVLSERTGIPEDELRRFAAGIHPLLARDRFAIMMTLTEQSQGDRKPDSEAADADSEARAAALAGCRQIVEEVEEEELLEEMEDALIDMKRES